MLLAIIVSAVLCFISVMVLLAFAAVCEYGQLRHIRFDPAARPFTLTLDDAPATDCALLWATQLTALQQLHASGSRGVKYEALYRTYQAAAGAYPELYEGSSFAQWLLFLDKQNLLALNRSRVTLTEHGQQFLQQCEAALQARLTHLA